MGRQPLLLRRHRASRRLDLAKRDGNEDDVLGRETHAAIERARDDGDLLRQSTAVSNMGSLMDALAAERDDIAAGVPTGGTLDAEAYVLVAQRQGACAVAVQDATVAVDEARAAYEQHILANPTRYAQKYGPPKMITGDERLTLRAQGAARQARYKEQGPVRVEDTNEHMELLGKMQAKHLARGRKRESLARQGIDSATLLPDVVPVHRVDLGQLFRVDYHVEAPPDEERTLWPTQEEAHDQATRWREILGRPRHAVRAAKAARGGVLNVQVHSNDDDLFCVQYKNKYRGKSRYVREPGTGGSYYYDWDAALQLKADYEKSNKDASWFVSAAEVRAVGKANQEAGRAKGRASQKRKRET